MLILAWSSCVSQTQLLFFGSDKCSECAKLWKDLSNSFEKDFAQIVKELNVPYSEKITLVNVVCDSEPSTCVDYNVTRGPVFFLVQNGNKYRFPAIYNPELVTKWAVGMIQNCLISVVDEEEISTGLTTVKMTSYFMLKAPTPFLEYIFAEFKGKVLAGWILSDTMELYVIRGGKKVQFEGDFTNSSQVRLFILRNKNPRFQLIKREVFDMLVDELPMAAVIVTPELHHSLILDLNASLQNCTLSDFNFGYIDATIPGNAKFLQQFNITQLDLPALVVIDFATQRHHVKTHIHSSADFLHRMHQINEKVVKLSSELMSDSESGAVSNIMNYVLRNYLTILLIIVVITVLVVYLRQKKMLKMKKEAEKQEEQKTE
ncbi:Protein_disulfide isomerase PDI2 [Hexamita inflata]|uniref:Protein disulfide isomerase PDI2 n=1 Tax=Hexamita inflata TaxID=28002 RepID=A0AA86P0H3_9EUKA|nr:Protein disulfide isomerase PDI2 [Hexamita inflata]